MTRHSRDGAVDRIENASMDYPEIIDRYFAGMDDTAFADGQAQWRGWSRFVDLLCALLLLQREDDPSAAVGQIGYLPDTTELSIALQPHARQSFPERERLWEIYGLLCQKSLPRSEEEQPLPLGRLLQSGRLKPVEWVAFLLALCVHVSRKYERLFGLLQDTAEGFPLPTVGLACDLCSLFLTEEEHSPALLLDPDRFLNRMLLASFRLPDGLSFLSKPLLIHRQAYAFALGEEAGLGELSAYAREPVCRRETGYICHRGLLEHLSGFYEGLRGLEMPPEDERYLAAGHRTDEEGGILFLEGEDGSGRAFLVEQLAAAEGKGLLVVFAEALLVLPAQQRNRLLREIACRCFFREERLLLRDFPDGKMDKGAAYECLSFLIKELGVLFISGNEYHKELFAKHTRIHRIAVPSPDIRAQKIFWELFAKELDIRFAGDIRIDHLVSKYTMTPGRIRGILQSVCKQVGSKRGGLSVGRDRLEEEIRGSNTVSFGEYAVKLKTSFTWEELQLTKDSERELLAAIDRIRLKSVVEGEYGFAKKLPYGSGTSIVLYGPPGTGKTMAAQILAKELGLDIYRIDLSQVESKYIGETEKSLGKIFEAAKHSNAILFFDEADSLFAKRTEVKDSNDRHANAQTAYLLQRIEEYAGVSILATNVFASFDEAFRRRMTFLVPMRWPDEAERLLLWQKVFPKETPLDKDVTFAHYARVGELTGSAIKAAAVSAAYRAAKDRRPVSHQDILAAIGDEYKKSGRSLSAFWERDRKSVSGDEEEEKKLDGRRVKG